MISSDESLQNDVGFRTVSVIVSPNKPTLIVDQSAPFNSVHGQQGEDKEPSNVVSSQTSQNVAPAANRMSYPREFKLLVISYFYKNGQNKYRTCKEFQITKSMLNGWLLKVDKIRQSRPGSLKSGRSGRKPQFPDVERQLFNMYQACLAGGQKVGNRWLRETAKNIARQHCSSLELSGMCQFSERWLCNFKKRFSINLTKDWTVDSGLGGSSSAGELVSSSTVQWGEENSISPIVVVERQQENPLIETPVDQPLNLSKPKKPQPLAEQYRSDPLGGVEPSRRGRKVQFPQVEKALYDRVQMRQAQAAKISNRWLQDEARRLAAQLCPELFTDAFKSAKCMFSEHWLHNFKRRYGLALIKPGQDEPVRRESLADTNDNATSAPNPASAQNQIVVHAFQTTPQGQPTLWDLRSVVYNNYHQHSSALAQTNTFQPGHFLPAAPNYVTLM